MINIIKLRKFWQRWLTFLEYFRAYNANRTIPPEWDIYGDTGDFVWLLSNESDELIQEIYKLKDSEIRYMDPYITKSEWIRELLTIQDQIRRLIKSHPYLRDDNPFDL